MNNKNTKILKTNHFKRPVLEVAPSLLGKFLVRKNDNGQIDAYMITEVEAYLGEEDLASHASKGRTKRTEVMYREGGCWYIYLIYGMHYMLNIVTGEKDQPCAILIRSLKKIKGPGRLTKTLKINMDLNAKPAIGKTWLWIEDRGVKVNKKDIKSTPRIGVGYAGNWAKKPYRFVLENIEL